MESPRKVRIFRWKLRGFVVACILGGITFVGYFIWTTRSTEEATCLAYVIDQKLDAFAIQKGATRTEIVERQIEAIARVEIKRALDQKATHCSASWVRWNVVARTRYIFGAKEGSPRWRLAFNGALNALRGNYKYPWPQELACVNEYAATKGPRNWGKRWSNRSKKVGDIDNMSLYCL